MVAPSFWIIEAANALWRHVRVGQLVQKDAARLLRRLEVSPLKSIDVAPDVQTAFTISADLKHPVYDCFYLALAIHLDTSVITADGRFQRAAARRPDLERRVMLLEQIFD